MLNSWGLCALLEPESVSAHPVQASHCPRSGKAAAGQAGGHRAGGRRGGEGAEVRLGSVWVGSDGLRSQRQGMFVRGLPQLREVTW